MKKKNNIWARIGAIAGALLALILVLGKVLGVFGKGYEMVQDVKKIPKLEARVDTVETGHQVLQKSVNVIDGKMDALLGRWNVRYTPDTLGR